MIQDIWYTQKELEAARQYWNLLNDSELQSFYNDDKTHPLRGMQAYTFEEWLIITARRSSQEIGMNS